MNPEWALALASSAVSHKSTASSDHLPILLQLCELHACTVGPRPFKYETMWERDETLFVTVRDRWSMQEGETVDALCAKLGGLAGDLSAWDRNHFGSVRQEIRQLKKQLEIMRSAPGRSARKMLKPRWLTDWSNCSIEKSCYGARGPGWIG